MESLPLADPALIEAKVEASLLQMFEQCIKHGATAQVVRNSIQLARELSADGKGYSVSWSSSEFQSLSLLTLQIGPHLASSQNPLSLWSESMREYLRSWIIGTGTVNSSWN